MPNLLRSVKQSTYLLLMGLINLTSLTFAGQMTLSNNKTISYTDVGKGKPIVLIHAFPTDQRLWEPQRNSLQHYFRIITLDLCGFGNSEPANGQAVTMSEYAEEINQLLNQLHIQNAIIGGESMGGYIALAFLEQYPDKVDGLILSNTQSIADNTETKSKREMSALEVLNNGTMNFINGFMTKALSLNAAEQTKEILGKIANDQTATGIASALRGMALRVDRSQLLSVTDKPILIISSDQDSLISPKQSDYMHELAANSKLVSISNAGHLSNLEQPEQWNQAVIEMFYQD